MVLDILLGQVYEEKLEDSIRGKAQQEVPQWSRGEKTKTKNPINLILFSSLSMVEVKRLKPYQYDLIFKSQETKTKKAYQ